MARLTVSDGRATYRLAVADVTPLQTKPGHLWPFTLLPTGLALTYTWDAASGEWRSLWIVHGLRRMGDRWSEEEIGSMIASDLAEVPEWISDAVDQFRPERDAQRLADVLDDGPHCRICGHGENTSCEGGCTWVPDPRGGDICSSHFVPVSALDGITLVRSADWADGEPVRVVRVSTTRDGQAAVYYQDAAASRPGRLVYVDPGVLVLPAESEA